LKIYWLILICIWKKKKDGNLTMYGQSYMGLGAHLYKNSTYDNNISSLFVLGFTYGDPGKGLDDVDPDAAIGIEWNFAVESAMTDWATLRLGYSHGYDFADGGTDVAYEAGVEDDISTPNVDETVAEVSQVKA
jgi:hypothetical protein